MLGHSLVESFNKTSNMAKEIYELKELFEDIQLNSVLEDGKTFVDCISKYSLDDISQKHKQEKLVPGFDRKRFVEENFNLPPAYDANYKSDKDRPVEENILALWDVLTRQPVPEQSSLLNLPYTYIVPGGRFREIYYWDSYFTMLGLKEHGRNDLIESMVDNFAWLIKNYGHIPNGNRSYYLSRSQPPFFALMITLLAGIREEESIYLKYIDELQKEYEFWQTGAEATKPDTAISRVVQMPGGEMLNRYFDNNTTPRPESYGADVHLSKISNQQPGQLYTNLRAGAESGWDFSSRWFEDGRHLETIQTTSIVPVDLNCLLYTLENTIAKAKNLAGDTNTANSFADKALLRKKAILKYCWNSEARFFCDYNFITGQQLNNITAAGLFPLFVNIATAEQAVAVAANTKNLLLKDGGIVTTTVHSGEQWDAPNGWAPLQWIAFTGLKNYGEYELANEIAARWLSLNEKVFRETGKLMEKYNVEDLDRPAGGGEYAGQDGFGWTNGIYMALKNSLG